MATIGKIVIGLGANTGELKKDLDKGRGLLSSFTGEAKGQAAKIGAAVAGAFAVKSIAAWANATIQYMTEVRHLADQLGTTTEGLSSLTYAASTLNNIDLSGMTDALGEMSKKLGEIEFTGAGEKRLLETMGLDPRTLAQMDPEQAFKKIADAVQSLGNTADRTMLADKIFGGQGKGLLPLLSLGSTGIEHLQAKSKELGATIDGMDSAKMADLSQQLADMGVRKDALGIKLLSEFGDELASVMTAAEWFAEVASDGFTVLQTAVTATGASIAHILQMLLTAAEYIPAVSVAEWLTGGDLSETRDMLGAVSSDLSDLASKQWSGDTGKPQAGGQDTKTPDSASTLGAIASIGDLTASLEKQIAALSRSESELQLYELALAGATQEQLASVEALQQQLDLATRTKEIIAGLVSPLDAYAKKLDELKQLLATDKITQDQFNAAMEKAREEIGLGADAAAKYAARLQEIQTAQLSAGLAQEDANKLMEKAQREFLGFGGAAGDLTQRLADLRAARDADSISQEEYNAAVSKANSEFGIGSSAVANYQARMIELKAALEAGTITQQEYNDAMEDAKDKVTGGGSSAISGYKSKLDELREALEKGIITQEEFDAEKRKAMQDAGLIDTSPLEEFQRKMKELEELKLSGDLTSSEFAEAAQKLRDELEQPLAIPVSTLMEEGSQEARESILKNMFRRPETPGPQVPDEPGVPDGPAGGGKEDLAKIEKDSQNVLKQILAAIKADEGQEVFVIS